MREIALSIFYGSIAMHDDFDFMNVGDLRQLVAKIGGKNNVQKLLDGRLVIKEWFPNLEVFATLYLGCEPKSTYGIRKGLKEEGIVLTDWADELLSGSHFEIAKTERKVDLVAVSAAQLGFAEHDSTYRLWVYETAKRFGLEPCPLEVGARLCYSKRLPEKLVIASDTSYERTFSLERRNGEKPKLDVEWLRDGSVGGLKLDRNMKLVFMVSPRIIFKLSPVD